MLTVVTGPPCAGKSTYIEEHAQHGDVIIDLDRIALALTTNDTTHHEYNATVRDVAIAARHAAITAAMRHRSSNVWIIDSKPSAKARRDYEARRARTVHLDPGIAVCMQRAREHRPQHAQAVIATYYGVE